MGKVKPGEPMNASRLGAGQLLPGVKVLKHLLHLRLPALPLENTVYVLQKGHCLPLPPLPLLTGSLTVAPQLVHEEPNKVALSQIGQIFPGIFENSY